MLGGGLVPSSVVLVTDSNVQRARGPFLEAALHPLAIEGTRVTLAPGERHKTLASASISRPSRATRRS